MSVFVDPDGTTWEVLSEDFDIASMSEPEVIYSTREGSRVRRPMTADERARSKRHSDWYAQFMRTAESAWSGPITALQEAGIDASLWQTGGMCLAIGAGFGDGHELMLTSVDDVLSQTPDEHLVVTEGDDGETVTDAPGWFLGVYFGGDEMDGDQGTYWNFDRLKVTDRSSDAELAREVAAIVAQAANGCVKCGTQDVGRFDTGRPHCRDCAGDTKHV